MMKESALAKAVSVHRLKETHGTTPGTIQCTSTPGGGGGGGQRLGLNHARMCVSKSEGNGFLFGFK